MMPVIIFPLHLNQIENPVLSLTSMCTSSNTILTQFCHSFFTVLGGFRHGSPVDP